MLLWQVKVRRSYGRVFHEQGVRFSFLLHTYLGLVSQRALQLPFATRWKAGSPPPWEFIYLSQNASDLRRELNILTQHQQVGGRAAGARSSRCVWGTNPLLHLPCSKEY